MHLRKAAWRNVLSALALVTFALPLATPMAQSASAQTVNPNPLFNPPSIAGVGSTTNGAAGASAVAFNPIGQNHTVTFNCTNVAPAAGVGSLAAGAVAGCYGVTASVQNSTTGDAATFAAATCANTTAVVNTATVNCAGILAGVCPPTTFPSGARFTINAAGTACTATITTADVAACTAAGGTVTTAPTLTTTGTCTFTVPNQMSVTINSGAPNVYTITFSGYVPAVFNPTTGAASCPAGTTGPAPAPVGLGLAGTLACQFFVSVQKKYVEINNVTLTGGPCGGSIQFSEGLKAFFGPSCTLTAVATGTTVLKTGVNCGPGGGEPATGSAAPAEFGAGATYSCTNGTLAVTGIPSTMFAGGNTLPFNFTVSGPASVNAASGVTLNNLCAGVPGQTTANGVTSVTLCPTGIGSGTVQACYASGPTVNTQPPVCSNLVNFTFTAPPASRVIPYVRWAGEKVVLTKCFGGAGLTGSTGLFAGALVRFSLQAGANTQATLIPAAVDVTGTGGLAGGTTVPGVTGATGGGVVIADAGQSLYTVADRNGCATVIAYARSEGVVGVDAQIYSTTVSPTTGAVPLLNEHAFTVYYLKFDHIDLENITFKTYNTADVLTPALTFTSSNPAPAGFFPSAPASLNATFQLPNPPGTGNVAGTTTAYSIPVCAIDFVRAMVHGYFELPGNPSGRPASNVAITGASSVNGAGTAAAGSYVLPAGRWVLPEDWPVLATFAGYTAPGSPLDITPSSVLAWDLNSGWVFNPSGENAVLCSGPATVPPANGAPGAITSFNTGPCFGNDAASYGGNWYSTAPAGVCAGGLTIGIGPFDATQACRTTASGQYAGAAGLLQPPGSSVLAATVSGTGVQSFSINPLSTNSTYLPNGTLNEWDAPMPPAQVSFGITSGPGMLDQVNKTGLYAICNTGTGAGAAANNGTITPCIPLGSALTSTGTVKTAAAPIYPNPFYAEAIPASPLIPPIINNGGYLWDSFGFRGGTVAGFTTAAATLAGATGTGTVAASTCPPGFTNNGTACVSTAATFTAAQCTAIGGTATIVAPATTGTCTVPYEPSGTVAGGTTTTNFGTNCPAGVPSSSTVVSVVNATGFTAGQTVNVYSTAGGTLATGLTISNVTGNTITFSAAPTTLFCALAGQARLQSNQLAITLPAQSVGVISTNPAAPTTVTLQQPNGMTVSTTAYAVGTTVYLNNAQGIATALAGCTITAAGGACAPGVAFLQAGTLVTTAPTIGTAPVTSGAGITPYPFWQWVGGNGTATNGTVYSDNHGEAVVSLETGVTSGTLQVAPVNGTCPAGYSFAPAVGSVPANCFLNLTQLGLAKGAPFGVFQNVATVTGGVASPTTAGCFNTSVTGTTVSATAATGATAQVGANGPAAGQICINGLGGLEFGPGAILGSTTIQAVADYPYTRGDHPMISSAPLTKVFTSAFSKSIAVTAGPAAPAGTGITNYKVTISAFDICGNPLVGEPVQVFALGNAGAVVLAPVGNGTALGTGNANVVIGPSGTATLSLEVLASALGQNGLVIKAVFPLEAVERIFVVQSGTAGQTTTVLYGPGYNMVGGPANSNFSMAEAVFSYNPTSNTYGNATASAGNLSSAPPVCAGYWAYFAAATAVNLTPTSKTGDTASCTLAPGFNLIGNPFGTPASIQSGFTAYHWNGTSYDVTQTIPVGGSVFIFNPGSSNTTVTLTAT